MSTKTFAAGGYRFIPAVFQYSGGVAAEPGFRLERVTFQTPVPLADGFERIAAIIRGAGRPLTAFAQCELRSPAPFTETGFRHFNEIYVETLRAWGLVDGDLNPVARSNVCPADIPPPSPSFYAFSYTVAHDGAAPSFAIAGSGEAREGMASYRDHIVRLGDVTPSGLAEKARFVHAEMERRMQLLGFEWHHSTAVQAYCVHDIAAVFARDIVQRGAARHGLTWHHCRPPIVDIEYEMDCRGVHLERTVV